MNKTTKWKSVLNDIDNYDVAGYIKEEFKTLLENVKERKISNILMYKDFLKDFIFYIDRKNTKAILNMIKNTDIVFKSNNKCPEKKMKYYLSTNARFKIPDDILYNIDFECSGFLTAITWMKGFLLLSIDEFCNASKTRIEINKLQLKMEERKEAKKLLNYK